MVFSLLNVLILSCIRFKKPEQISFDLIGELAAKISVNEWIRIFETRIHP